jgi:hypothetical protein
VRVMVGRTRMVTRRILGRAQPAVLPRLPAGNTPWFSFAIAAASGPVLRIYLRRRNGRSLRDLVRSQAAGPGPASHAYAHVLLLISALATNSCALVLWVVTYNIAGSTAHAASLVFLFVMSCCITLMVGHCIAYGLLNAQSRVQNLRILRKWLLCDAVMFVISILVFVGFLRAFHV